MIPSFILQVHFLHTVKSEGLIIYYYPNFFNSQKGIIALDILVIIVLAIGIIYIIRNKIYLLHKIIAYPLSFTITMLIRFIIALIFLKPPNEYDIVKSF